MASLPFLKLHKELKERAPGGFRSATKRIGIMWAFTIVLASCLLYMLSTRRELAVTGRDPTWFIAFLTCALPTFGSWAAASSLGRWAYPRMIRNRHPEEVTITADAGGIRSQSPRGRTRFRWSFFTQHAESTKSFALRGRKMNAAPMVLLVVPKAAFANQQDVEEFRQLLQEKAVPDAARSAGVGGFPVRVSGREQVED